MRLKFSFVVAFLLALVGLACGQLLSSTLDYRLGGNITALRPGYTPVDLSNAEQSVAYLPPGSIMRFNPVFWEIFWTPDETKGNFRGIDKEIEIAMKNRGRPLFCLSPCPYPSSPWYSPGFTDWWVPKESVRPKIYQCLDVLIKRIEEKCKAAKLSPLYQLLNEPAGRLVNPLLGNKPGGSNSTEFGEWHPSLHPFAYEIAKVLGKNGVSTERIIGPAVSCIGEKREAVEWITSKPPAEFDWQQLCGWRAYNFRYSAGWATNPQTRLAEVARGFQWCADYLEKMDKTQEWPKGQRVMLTEVYVTPGDCGTYIGDDLNPYRKIAFDLCKQKGWLPVFWGLLPKEADDPNNVWFFYGGWGDFLKWLLGL